MNTLKKLACCLPILTMGVSHAALLNCEGYKVTVNNLYGQELKILNVTFKGAELKSEGAVSSPIISVNGSRVYTVTNTSENDGILRGSLTVATKDDENKQVTVKFSLKNKDLSCSYRSHKIIKTALTLDEASLGGGVDFYVKDYKK